jgi:hypothetical protein
MVENIRQFIGDVENSAMVIQTIKTVNPLICNRLDYT